MATVSAAMNEVVETIREKVDDCVIVLLADSDGNASVQSPLSYEALGEFFLSIGRLYANGDVEEKDVHEAEVQLPSPLPATEHILNQ